MADSAPRLSTLDRIQPALLLGSVGVGLAIGHWLPAIGSRLDSLVAIGVFALIYLVMLGVDPGGVWAALRDRRFVAVAVGVNFVVNPLLVWALSSTLLSDPDLRAGLVLFLVTPCIGWYLVFTQLSRGDTTLGVGLLGVNLLLQVLLLPLYLWLFVGTSAGVSVGGIAGSVIVFLVVPAAAASATRTVLRHVRLPRLLTEASAHRGYANLVVLTVVIVAMFASEAEVLFDHPGVVLDVLAPLLVFFALAFGVALVAARLFGLAVEQRNLLVFTTTSRNPGASLAVAATAFASPLVPLVVVIGPVVELPLLVLMVRVLRSMRGLARPEPAVV